MNKIALTLLALFVSITPGWTQVPPGSHPPPPPDEPREIPPPPPNQPSLDRLIDLITSGFLEEAERMARELREQRERQRRLEPEWMRDREVQSALQFLRQHLPREFEELMGTLETGWTGRPCRLDELIEQYHQAMELQRENPEAFARDLEIRRMESEAWAIGERIQHTKNEEEKQALEKELRQILNRIFEERQEQRRTQIEDMRKELEQLEQSVKRLDENREKAIERKLREMTGQEDELDFM